MFILSSYYLMVLISQISRFLMMAKLRSSSCGLYVCKNTKVFPTSNAAAALLHCLDVTDAGAGLSISGGGVGCFMTPWSRRHVTTIWSPTLTLDCCRTAASSALTHAGSRHQGFPSPSSCSLSTSWIICTEAGMSIFAKQTFMCVSIKTNDHKNQQCKSVTRGDVRRGWVRM